MQRSKIALVTGGYGFIGSHMVDLLLKKKFEVRVIDNLIGGHKKNLQQHKGNKKLKIKIADICNLKKNDKFLNDINYIFHFAGIGDIVPSIENPSVYFKTNVSGTINLLSCINIKNIKKFVYAASSSCYGIASTPTKENSNINPLYPYALSKYMGESAVMHWSKVYKLNSISMRIFNAYGPRVRTTGAYGAVFGVFFKQKLAGLPYTIVGNGKQKRDFLYVTDVVEAFYKASLSKYKSEIYNLGHGNPQSINYLTKLIGKNSKIFIPKRPAEPEKTFADISKIKKDLKWKPVISFEKGVSEMMKEIDKWSNAPLWTESKINKATEKWFKYLKDVK